MAPLAKGFSVFLFRLLLLVVVSLQLKIASSKTPEESLVCFTNESLTKMDTDGHKYAQSAQDWQHSVDHTPCYSHLTCDASANGIHVPTSKATVYAVPGHDPVFVVTLDSTEPRLLLTVDLRTKSCSFSKLITYPPGFLVECMRNSSTQPIWLIPVQHSSGEWMEKEPLRVGVADDGKAVNRGVSAVMEANNRQWYFFARQDLLCYMDLEQGPAGCLPVAQGKCHHIAKILPVQVWEHTGVLLACTGGEGKQHMDYVALYETGSAKVTKSNYPTGQFKAIHVSSSGDFTVFVGATYISVVRTLDSSSSARQREVSVPGDVEFSIVSDKMLLYTTREADSRSLPTYKTYALDFAKSFEEGTLAELLEGDNCTVTQQLALGEWIVACSEAMFWYRGNVSDRVHIPWLDGTARQQRCFTSLARAEPVTEHTATTSLTPPATHAPTPHQGEQWKIAAITVSSLLLTILVAVIVVILVVCSRRCSRKAGIKEIHTGPGPVDSPEGVEEFGCAGQRDDDAASLASSQSSSLPARNEVDGMSHASTDDIHYGSSPPQNNGGAYQHTRIGFPPDASSVDSISNCYSISENGTPPADVESSECEQLSGVDSTGVADSGTTVTSDQGAAGESESTLQASTRTRTPGNGCS